jgi:hypothetical protein
MLTLTDRHNTVLTISQTNEGGLHLQIEGGPFNRNQTSLSAEESQEFLGGLRTGNYQLSRLLLAGGLEFVTVWGYTSLANNRLEYELSIQSSKGGQLDLGSFRCESLEEISAGVERLLGGRALT